MSLKDTLLDLFGIHTAEPPAPKPDTKPRQPPRPAKTAHTVRSESEVLAVVRGVGGEFRRVVFTRNRRVMASVAERGAALRLNAAFAAAPEEVLRAVGVLFSTRDRRRRERARAAVRRFIAEIPAAAAPERRARRVPRTDRPHLERLRAEFDRVNREKFGGELPAVPLFLSGRMRSRNGHFSTHPLEIVISRRLCVDAQPGEAEQTLRHEMIHLWQHATGRKPDHGREFRAWARRLGVHPRARRSVSWREE